MCIQKQLRHFKLVDIWWRINMSDILESVDAALNVGTDKLQNISRQNPDLPITTHEEAGPSTALLQTPPYHQGVLHDSDSIGSFSGSVESRRSSSSSHNGRFHLLSILKPSTTNISTINYYCVIKNITMYTVPRKHFFTLSSNSEVFASEILWNLDSFF